MKAPVYHCSIPPTRYHKLPRAATRFVRQSLRRLGIGVLFLALLATFPDMPLGGGKNHHGQAQASSSFQPEKTDHFKIAQGETYAVVRRTLTTEQLDQRLNIKGEYSVKAADKQRLTLLLAHYSVNP